MKSILSFLFCFPFLVSAQLNLKWSEEIVVNDDDALGYARPKISLLGGTDPIVLWSKRTNQEVYTAKWNGSGFGNAKQMTPAHFHAYAQDWVGPDMVSNGQTVYITYESESFTDGYMYVLKSTDGGATFSDTLRVNDEKLSRFPVLGLSYDGTLYLAYMAFEAGDKNPHYMMTRSIDGGKTFSDPVKATGTAPGESCDCCPAKIVALGDEVTLMFRNNEGNLRNVWASTSLDGGKTFTRSKKIDNSGWVINGCPATGPSAILSGDTLTAVWMNGATGRSRVMLGTAGYSNLEIDINQEISSNLAPDVNQDFPMIAGQWNIYGAVWEELSNGKRFIKFVAGANGPSSLLGKTAITVNSDTNGLAKNPSLVYANGTFHITWGDNKTKKVYYRSVSLTDYLSINEPSQVSIDLYPNPSNGIVSITGLTKVQRVYVKDNLGKAVPFTFSQNSSESKLDLNTAPAGLYFVTFYTESGVQAVRVMRE